MYSNCNSYIYVLTLVQSGEAALLPSPRSRTEEQAGMPLGRYRLNGPKQNKPPTLYQRKEILKYSLASEVNFHTISVARRLQAKYGSCGVSSEKLDFWISQLEESLKELTSTESEVCTSELCPLEQLVRKEKYTSSTIAREIPPAVTNMVNKDRAPLPEV